jgi:replicative DNA helicase
MDLDLAFVKAILSQEGAFNQARHYGITGEMLKGDGVKCWDFVCNHYSENGEVPSEDLTYAKIGISFPESADGIKSLISEIKKRSLWERSVAMHEKMGDILDNRSNMEALLPLVNEYLVDVYKSDVAGQKIGSLLALGPDVMAFYNRLKNGERGVLTPWAEMNDATLGWWPGDFVVFAARMGVGKTFTLLLLARQAWVDGHKVLFVGTEMNRLNLAMRFYSIHLKLPYRDFRRGRLVTNMEERAQSAIEMISGDKGLNVVGDDFDADINVIISAVEQTRPDIVFVDGIYLVKNKGHDRHTRVSNTADDLKRMAKRLQIPVIATTQFNREVSSNTRTGISAENIGISDVIGWNADVMYGQFQTDDMKEDLVMGYRPLKLREGKGNEFFVKWDFDTMDFRQDATSADVDKKYTDDYDGIPGATVDGGDYGDEIF